jgi:hypothetical protein
MECVCWSVCVVVLFEGRVREKERKFASWRVDRRVERTGGTM